MEQQLVVILLSSIHPIAYLYDRFRLRHTGSEGVVVGTGEAIVDVAENVDVHPFRRKGILVVNREDITECVSRPCRFFRHAEPSLPADGAEHCTARQQ